MCIAYIYIKNFFSQIELKAIGYGENPSIRMERLKEINRKVEDYKCRLSRPDSFRLDTLLLSLVFLHSG